MTRTRTRVEIEKKDKAALDRVTVLVWEATDLRRERDRLLRWVRRWLKRHMPLEKTDAGGWHHWLMVEIRAALRGEEPPRRRREAAR